MKTIFRIPYYILGSYVRSRDWHYAKLVYMMLVHPNFKNRYFTFPFGKIQYIDIHSLVSQYYEIFVKKGYHFYTENKNPVIIDCGGNIGLSVIWFKIFYPGSKITVFEPHPKVFHILVKNIKQLNCSNIVAKEVVISDKNDIVRMNIKDSDSSHIVPGNKGLGRPSIRLSDIINKPVDLLKLDIEGSEYGVLFDLFKTHKIDYIQKLICEFHGSIDRLSSLGKIFINLTDNGFHFTINYARSAPELFDYKENTPFIDAPDAKFLLHLYAWKS